MALRSAESRLTGKAPDMAPTCATAHPAWVKISSLPITRRLRGRRARKSVGGSAKETWLAAMMAPRPEASMSARFSVPYTLKRRTSFQSALMATSRKLTIQVEGAPGAPMGLSQ